MSIQPIDLVNESNSEACWSLIERVAAAQSLKRAARLREFLFYVGAQAPKNGRTDIHEQEIGENVFGRQRAYETSQDNIVRVSATELRKRIENYFATEGSAEPIVFEIPRGTYVPAFRMRAEAMPHPRLAEPVAYVEAAPPQAKPAAQGRLVLWIISAVAIILAVACIELWLQNRALERRIELKQAQPVSEISPGILSPAERC